MYKRLFNLPPKSSFVFGPRGIGKSTWLKSAIPDAEIYDLLDTQLYLDLTRDPNELYRELSKMEPATWIVIDEIQRIPDLLNVVRRLIETSRLHFVMTVSNTRKLRQGGVDLLARRASKKQMFPPVSSEIGDEFDQERSLRYGSLPMAARDEFAIDYLRSYAQTYLVEEIFAESLIRNTGTFSRFLETAARENGQIVNPAAIAREVGVSRPTVVSHFRILIETMMGTWLPAWKLDSSNRQLQQSKFYFFDCGVVRALTKRVAYPPTDEERKALLETLIFNELRAFLDYSRLYYPLHYWRTYDGAEVAFLVQSEHGYIAIEVKSSTLWQRKFNRGLNRLAKQFDQHDSIRRFGVFRGARAEHWDDIHVLPASEFLSSLWRGEIIS